MSELYYTLFTQTVSSLSIVHKGFPQLHASKNRVTHIMYVNSPHQLVKAVVTWIHPMSNSGHFSCTTLAMPGRFLQVALKIIVGDFRAYKNAEHSSHCHLRQVCMTYLDMSR